MMTGKGFFIYGLFLVLIFIAIIIYFYKPSRKSEVEEAKYTMLEDDDEKPKSGDNA